MCARKRGESERASERERESESESESEREREREREREMAILRENYFDATSHNYCFSSNTSIIFFPYFFFILVRAICILVHVTKFKLPCYLNGKKSTYCQYFL